MFEWSKEEAVAKVQVQGDKSLKGLTMKNKEQGKNAVILIKKKL